MPKSHDSQEENSKKFLDEDINEVPYKQSKKSKEKALKETETPKHKKHQSEKPSSEASKQGNLKTNSSQLSKKITPSNSSATASSIIETQRKCAESIALSQFQIKFSITVFRLISHPSSIGNDFSQDLFQPFLDFGIFQNFDLSESQFEQIIFPLIHSLISTMSKSHTIEELFTLLITIINFSQRIGKEAVTKTTVYVASLHQLEIIVNKIMFFLVQNLASIIAPSVNMYSFTYIDELLIDSVKEETNHFLTVATNMKIPLTIKQSIITETCRTIDSMLFNVVIQNVMPIDSEMICCLMQKINVMKKLFQVEIGDDAFEWTMYLIRTVDELNSGIKNFSGNNPFLRLIAERIEPKIVLPSGITLEMLGPLIDDKSQLCLTKSTITEQFSFDDFFQ
ncbi:hypothetical protein GPJ56_010593 [Histomonas meleagridis]|uniref:uncharacterized protein n=1 Tax=Histomonas meleagridis TaxID=135588 RepID=UPI0035593DAE|nr:hypothetical protein GPJ56_010593 [Histomonas meleagridis]KAH0803988.1 hypothetical protein GO595_002818 [Histomonas meleagridis]